MLWTLKKETRAFPSQYLSFIKLVGVADSSAADFHGNSYKNCQNWAHVGHDACWSLVQWRRDEVIIFATAATATVFVFVPVFVSVFVSVIQSVFHLYILVVGFLSGNLKI